MLWENTFPSCVLEQCCQSWSVLRKCISLQKYAEMLIFLRKIVYLWDLNPAKGIRVGAVLSFQPFHRNWMACVSVSLSMGSAGTHRGQLLWFWDWEQILAFLVLPVVNVWDFWGNCPRVGCCLSATGATTGSTGHCLLLWAQPTVRQYKTKREQKCACKTYTCQGHVPCPAALLPGHSKY